LSEEERETRRGFIGGYSPFFGVGAFALIELPEPWELRMSPEPLECDMLGDWCPEGGFRWVLRGKVKALLVNPEARRAYLMSVEARDFRRPSDAEAYVARRLGKLEADPRSEVLEKGFLEVSGHRGRYLALVRRRKRLLRGEEVRHVLVAAFFCERTERLLWLELAGGSYLLEDLEELKPIIASISCHGQGP